MNKGILSRIFSNKLFLIILSVVISLTIWISINMGDYAETSYSVSNIPITIDLPDTASSQGLKVFNNDELKGTVTVSGNRSIIGNLTSDDIEIVPEQTDNLTSAGSYTLSLVAKKKSSSLNYTIESVSPSTVYIKLDRNRNITKKIEQNISYTIPKDYYGTVLLDNESVTISGPETEIKKIDKVVIEGNVKEELKSSVTNEYDVKLLDSFGEEIKTNDTLTISPSKVKATVSVLQKKDVNVELSTVNGPSGIDLTKYCKIEPNSISLGADSSNIENITKVNIEPIDFSTLRNKDYKINKNLDIPNKCVDINSVNSVVVNMDLSSLEKKTITLTDFDIKGLDKKYSANVTTQSVEVTLYGTKSALKNIDENDIDAVIDFTGTEVSAGSRTMPLNLTLKDKDGCWIYGSYEVVVEIS